MPKLEQICKFAARAVLLLFLMPADYASAQPAAKLPWMTGERLVKLTGNVDARTVEWSPQSGFPSRAIAAEYQDMVNGEFVHGYIQAAHDSTEGREWCWTHSKPKQHILIENARRHLQQLASTELQRNASSLIVEQWRKQFPCRNQIERRPK